MNLESGAESGLARAARAFLARAAAAQPEPAEQFLQRHAELREWLEPMLAAEADGVAADDPAAEAVLGPFRLRHELGRGGMGVVHEAVRGADPTPIALKLLPGFLGLQGGRAARFEREAQIARGLDHPGVVRVLDDGAIGDTRYLAMVFVVGAPLDRVLHELAGREPASLTHADLAAAVAATLHVPRGAVAPPSTGFHGSYVACVVRVAIQLADALAHVHAAGVIHRDVKPSNVLLGADGHVVLTDLGLARSASVADLTLTGDFAGTPHYVSPEQAMAKRVDVDHRTDLFSLGSTLYELLTLQKAFPGDSTPAVLARILTKEPPPATRWHPGLPADLVTVLAKLLEKDPDRRYADAAAAAADLRAFLDYRPVLARRSSTWTRLARWSVREPLRATLAAVLLVTVPALAAAGGYLLATADEVATGAERMKADAITAQVDAGFEAFVLEDAKRAVTCFEAARALAPERAEVVVGLVLALLRRDGPEAALARLDGDLAAAAPAGVADLLRFALLHRLGRPEAAAVMQRWPEPSTDLEFFLRALLDRDRGEVTGSRLLEDVERAVLSSERPRLWIHLHWAVFADAAGDAASCRNCAATLLANWPESSIARYYATFALRRVEPERMQSLVRDAIAKHPDDGLLHWAEGMVLSGRGDVVGAVPALERAAARLPAVPSVHYALGKARFERGDHAGALAAMERAAGLSPRFVEAWLGAGMALARLGRSDDALDALRHAVALHGSHADARFQLGQLLVQREELAAGLAELRIAAKLNEADPNKWHHVAHAAFASGDEDGGLAALQRAIAAMPSYERGHAMLVGYCRERGTPAEARDALLAWVQAIPGSADGWAQLAEHCLLEDLPPDLGDPAAAVWAAGRVLALTGERSAAGWRLLGEARAALGQSAAARAAWQRALTATPPLSDAARRRIELALRELDAKK